MHPMISQFSDAAPVLLTYGPLGVMVCWFMLKGDQFVTKFGTQIADLAHRVDGLTKALLMDMLERDSSGHNTKRIASEAIAKIDARAARDDKRPAK